LSNRIIFRTSLLLNNLLDNCIARNTTIVEFDNYIQYYSVKVKVPRSPRVTVVGYCKRPDRRKRLYDTNTVDRNIGEKKPLTISSNMSGRCQKSNGNGGRGRNDRQGRGGGRGQSYTAPVRHQRVGFARHSVAACSTTDTSKPQTRCAHHGRSWSNTSGRPMDKTSATNFRTRLLSPSPNPCKRHRS
jgi:hypothetical protein